MKKIMLVLPLLLLALGGCDSVDPEIKEKFEEHKKLDRPINCAPGFGEEGNKTHELCKYAREQGYKNFAE